MCNQPAIFIFITMLTLCGCANFKSHNVKHSSGKGIELAFAPNRVGGKEVLIAYEQARASMLQERRAHVDVLWVLHQFADSDAELKAFVDHSKSSISDPHFVPGVFSNLPRVELPEHPDRGIRKFIHYLQAAFGHPGDRALLWLQDFISAEEEGYVLTHQFLGLIWAEQADLPFTEKMRSRKRELWLRIYEEQCSVDRVDSVDLYMERIAIVLMYGHPEDVDPKAVDKWIVQIVDLQLDDGSWPLSKTQIMYDGAFTEVSSPRSHTTALAMMALNAYIHK